MHQLKLIIQHFCDCSLCLYPSKLWTLGALFSSSLEAKISCSKEATHVQERTVRLRLPFQHVSNPLNTILEITLYKDVNRLHSETLVSFCFHLVLFLLEIVLLPVLYNSWRNFKSPSEGCLTQPRLWSR